MCAIYLYLSSLFPKLSADQRKALLATLEANHCRLSARGPDEHGGKQVNEQLYMEFYRLAINGVAQGMQPFHLPTFPHLTVMCNGELYNHVQLEEQMKYKNITGSDCEVIMPLYERYGFLKACQLLDGVFAISLWDEEKQQLWIGRDRFGVRPLYFCAEESDGKIVALQAGSELKSLTLVPTAKPVASNGSSSFLKAYQIEPGTIRCYQYSDTGIEMIKSDRYFAADWSVVAGMTKEQALLGINKLLTEAVSKRLMSERPIGCLLSGGLDSSLVAAIVAREMHKLGKQVHSFAIGMSESTDIKFARIVASHIGTIHHEFILSPEEFLAEMDHVIEVIESWDTTTVRASVGNYLVCKKIKEFNKKIDDFNVAPVVIFNGDGSDEVAGGYLYHKKAPSDLDYHLEQQRLLTELYMFDVLRSDRTISDNGLEARTPFLDNNFISFYMSIPLDIRANRSKQEKWLIREAFADEGLLPHSVLFRCKEAFSDGVSGTEKSWWEIIHDSVENKVADSELGKTSKQYDDPVTTSTKEALYFRKKFDEYYPGQSHTIAHYWLPKWSGMVTNPSARCLTEYDKQAQQITSQ